MPLHVTDDDEYFNEDSDYIGYHIGGVFGWGDPRYWGSRIMGHQPEFHDIIWIGGKYYYARKKGLLRRKYPNLIRKTLPHEILHQALDMIDESEASDILDNYEVFGYMGDIDPRTGLRPFDEIERAMKRRRKHE